MQVKNIYVTLVIRYIQTLKKGGVGRTIYLYNPLPVLTGFKTVAQSNVY